MRLFCALPTITLLALAHTLGVSTEAAAQDTPPIAVGQRVRVTTESGATHVGLVTALSSGALELQGEGGSQRFPAASVTRLEVSRGRKSRAELGAGIGFTAGALGAVVYCQMEAKRCVVFDDDTTPLQALAFGAMGSVVGGFVGWFITTDRWEGVPLERLRVSLAPQGGGRFALGFSVKS